MNLLFRVIFATHCTSTHHKLALDALCHLDGRRASSWQNLFLKHHKLYLEGSKAPDKEFKDFRNHVLHVRDNYWGGASATARRWYDRTVESLGRRDWPDSVYSAGVLSHYYTDPIQPFHTGQSEAESNIHRAAEWSITKSYDAIRQILEDDGGYPNIQVPSGADWLEQMVIEGANAANPYYETLIERYDMRRGVKDPPAGLDQESREILAKLVGHAIVGFARIIERAIDDSHAIPPRVDVTLAGFLATLEVPVKWVTRKLADAKERKLVTAMYDELQSTGRVDKTLPEDDRIVRDLHDQEVVKRSLLREPPSRETVKPAAMEKPVIQFKPMEETRSRLPEVERHVQAANSADDRQLCFYLEPSDHVADAPSIGPKTADRLAKIGVATVADLLDLNPATAAAQLDQRHITSSIVEAWQDQARLACQIPQIRGHDAAILVACGWNTPQSIANTAPRDMLDVVEQFVATSEGERIIRSGKKPDLGEVTDWISWARHARSLKAA